MQTIKPCMLWTYFSLNDYLYTQAVLQNMKFRILFSLFFAYQCCYARVMLAQTTAGQPEPHRPLIHFTPARNWMNDPNGMLFHKGTYHLFFQHYPDAPVWGPMHWGHATSTDLVRWQEQPIALYPDSMGYIFSGSAVVDSGNTSGFGREGKPPLVAIFTHHDPKGEKLNDTFQYQSLAYSNDDGRTWTKYPGNPVLRNPGIRDFRDPKVFWHEPLKRWIMSLATKDCVTFYSAPDLKDWQLESSFGKGKGAQGGVWECPDLFALIHNGKKIWVLLVNINPGAPNGGSGTQYFLGDFDGHQFTPIDEKVRWMDYGPDNYAGVTWSNTGDRRLLIGWMSNWDYANKVPTQNWRSAFTVVRELYLKETGGQIRLASHPVKELSGIEQHVRELRHWPVKGTISLKQKTGITAMPCRIDLLQGYPKDFSVILRNAKGEELVAGYDKLSNRFYIDRMRSGDTTFHPGFGARQYAPRVKKNGPVAMTLIIDVSSLELFADDGLSCMTALFFPSVPFTDILLRSPDGIELQYLRYAGLKSIR